MRVSIARHRISQGMQWVDAVHVRAAFPRGVVFVPPLIGGDMAQQVRNFRPLVRRGYDLVSFTYAGHGKSPGIFSIRSAIRNCVTATGYARTLAADRDLPLYAIGCCYAAVPLIHGAMGHGEPFHGIVLVNPVLYLEPAAILISFLRYHRDEFRPARAKTALFSAIRAYVDDLFPGIPKSGGAFGVLKLKRARPFRIVFDLFNRRMIRACRLTHTKSLCLYGYNDPILSLDDGFSTARYERRITGVFPRIRFRRLQCDHFLSHSFVRAAVLSDILSFLARHPRTDRSPKPAARGRHGWLAPLDFTGLDGASTRGLWQSRVPDTR